jgi:hypothetical protein
MQTASSFRSPDSRMCRAQIVYALRAQMGAAGLHVGTNDLLDYIDTSIRRETPTKDGCVVERDELIAQVFKRSGDIREM